jgi:hypothetical protein
MKKILFTLQIILFFLASLSGQETELFYLSGRDAGSPVEWDFRVDKGMKANIPSKIPVPSNWELHGFGAYNYGHDKNKSDETGFYKHLFQAKKSWENKTIIIVFEGSMTDTEVKINGKLAGAVHQGGFYRFEYDISDLIHFDKDNLLEVKVNKVSADKSVEIAERKSDYWVFGGIYRPVYLKILPKEHIVRTAINAKADGNFRIDVYYAGIKNTKNIEAKIIGTNGKVLGKPFSTKIDTEKDFISLNTKVTGQKNWTAESPTLYYVDISLKRKDKTIHTVRKRFGFRTIEVRESKGIFLNGHIITLKGADRHSFWPTSGRTLSRKQCYNDVMLLKEMNMNAVRMSHYPPDTYFLDLCDEHGIYVLDELAGWQRPSYDTKPGKRLLKEMITRDVNHPSILFWDNGNEGGWNKKLDKEFAKYDPQGRKVLHPWALFSGIDTDHYESYASVQNKMKSGNIFMPTEHLHGLYDGGHGAGLDDFWKLMWGNPLNGGMFLWVFADEGVVRTDKEWIIDTDGNHAPDGILGPFHEKEASFYTIKEIWSPVYIETNNELTDDFNGTIPVENRYDFANLNKCTFKWQLIKYAEPKNFNGKNKVITTGYFRGPDIPARKNGLLKPGLPDNWKASDAFILTAYDKNNIETHTWKWKIVANKKIVENTLKEGNSTPKISGKGNYIKVSTDNFSFSFSKKTGLIETVKNADKLIPFNGGPVFVSDKKKETVQTEKLKINLSESKNSQVIEISNHPDFDQLKWTVYGSGWLKLAYSYTLKDSLDYLGVSFNFPENKILGMKCLSKGPYRVWKNRLKGQNIDVWQKNYNNFKLNTKWDYPEFPGYFADFSWAVFDTEDGYFTILTENDDLFMRIFKQKDGKEPRHTAMIWPKGDISFLHAIPAIGTKFQKAKVLGPQSQKFKADDTYSATLFFYFGLTE